MKSIKAMLVLALMGVSVAAMAEDGGDKVMARMIAARDASMAHYLQAEHARTQTAVVTNQGSGSGKVQRTN